MSERDSEDRIKEAGKVAISTMRCSQKDHSLDVVDYGTIFGIIMDNGLDVNCTGKVECFHLFHH